MSLDLQKLAAAKLWLISPPAASAGPAAPRDLPYLIHALYALVPLDSDEVTRMTCDEHWRIYVNPAWLHAASVPEVGAELAHLVWHLLAEHTSRARDVGVDRRTAGSWKKASDITISHTLDPDRLRPGHLPDAGDVELDEGLTTEEYYALLSGLPAERDESGEPLDPGEGCGSGADGIRRRHEIPADADIAAITAFESREIRRRVAIDYRDHITKRGSRPGDDLRWITHTLDPTIPWEPLLGGAVRRAIGWAAGRGDYSYSRPSRRASLNPRVVLPGQQRPVPRLSLIVDTSGSVDDQLLQRALGEVDSVIAALGLPGSSVTVYSVDAAVHTVNRVRRSRDAKLVGAGGTDLRIGIYAAEHERPRPDVIVVFTDGDTPWPATPPIGAAVIAVILGRDRERLPQTPAWAVRVECLVD